MKADFSFIRYANCWEDAELMVQNLRPEKGNRILSIASAGDNTLALLASEPSEIVGFDINPVQLFLSELKQRSIQCLERNEVLCLLGVEPSDRRLFLFKALKGKLSAEAYAYFEQRPELIENGLIHAGKFENYFRIFRTRVLPLIHKKANVDELFREKAPEEQLLFFNESWNNWRWRLLFKFFFSRFVMGRLGRDPEFFKEVEAEVGQSIYERASRHLSSDLVFKNHFLDYQLRGNFNVGLPLYLQELHYEKIVQNIDKVRWCKGYLTDMEREGKFHRFNLSNIFEYMNKDLFMQQLKCIKGISEEGALCGHWNLLVPRDMQNDSHYSRSAINGSDLCFFYMNYNIYQLNL